MTSCCNMAEMLASLDSGLWHQPVVTLVSLYAVSLSHSLSKTLSEDLTHMQGANGSLSGGWWGPVCVLEGHCGWSVQNGLYIALPRQLRCILSSCLLPVPVQTEL